MTMRRYLLVLDMDLLAVDEEFDLEPINYFVAQQERAPCDVVVLSLVNTSSAKLPAMELPRQLHGGNPAAVPSR